MAFKWPWARPLEVRASYTNQALNWQYASATGSGSVADAAATTARREGDRPVYQRVLCGRCYSSGQHEPIHYSGLAGGGGA